MPIYGYACTECGHTLEELQKISDPPLVDCPECHEPALKRQLSAPRFRLKGQGWYETDFKKDNQRNLAGEKEAAKSGDKADAATGDGAKPAPATEKKSDSKADSKAAAKASASPKKAGAGDAE